MMSATAVAPDHLRRRPEMRFPIRFVCISVALAVVWAALQPTWRWLCTFIARVVAWLADVVGLHATVEPGAHVRFGSDGGPMFRYVVSDECTAVLVLATYAAAVLAYPTTRRNWVAGLVVGIPVLFGLNLLRLVTLGWVGLHAPGSFDAVHRYWWQVFYVVGTGALWFGWAWWTSDARSVLAGPRPAAARRLPVTPILVGGQLTAFAVIGLWGHGADLYFRLLRIPLGVLTYVLWGGEIATDGATDATAYTTFTGVYALLAAVIALFLVSPGLDLRTRLQGVVRWALPSAFAMHVVEALWTNTVQVNAATEGTVGPWHFAGRVTAPLVFALHIGLSLAVWHVWLQRTREREQRRQSRAAARRLAGRRKVRGRKR